MRRRTIFLAAGLLAYFFGATVRAYQRYPECGDSDVGCRILVTVEYRQVALRHPLRTIKYLIAPAPPLE
ncbi:MAG: hypothetical protein M3444_22030 [Acidobacteriota bacterium]|nr:hypothetical protein [Acidobacteriota bacterium]MDQ5835469.1 hypothetical protein [Acidobacteriota bacterium]